VTAVTATSQQPGTTPPIVPPEANQKAPEKPVNTDEQAPVFRSEAQLVNIYFNVKDKRGALIPSLRKEDFEIYEDGVKQNIKFFSAETNLPLTLGILLDTSGSQMRVLPMEKEVGAGFLKEVITPKDMAFLINFDVNVELLQDFTSSTSMLRKSMQTARINTGGSTGSNIPGIGQGPVPIDDPRGTLLYDAIYLASTEKLAKEVGRKAMIILTDGMDYGSKVKIKEAIEVAQKADAICYVLLVADPPFYGSGGRGGGYFGEGEMKKLTQETGGRMIDVGDNTKDLKSAFDQIADELRSQYTLAYTPTNLRRDGAFRKIEIKSKAGKVQARRGYYAPLN
jgi:VWFA-related protein